LPSNVETRAVVSSSDSIMGAFTHTDRNLLSDAARFKGICSTKA